MRNVARMSERGGTRREKKENKKRRMIERALGGIGQLHSPLLSPPPSSLLGGGERDGMVEVPAI